MQSSTNRKEEHVQRLATSSLRMIDMVTEQLEHWTKECLLSLIVPSNASVCEIGFNGIDFGKWTRANPSHFVGISVQDESIKIAKERWLHKGQPFPAEFLSFDPSEDEEICRFLESKNVEKGGREQFDAVVCFQNFDSAFTNELRCRRLLRNVGDLLRPGGFFFGLAADSASLFNKFLKGAGSFRIKSKISPFFLSSSSISNECGH